MNYNFNYAFNISGNCNAVVAEISEGVNDLQRNLRATTSLWDSFEGKILALNQFTQYVQNLGNALDSTLAPGAALNAYLQFGWIEELTGLNTERKEEGIKGEKEQWRFITTHIKSVEKTADITEINRYIESKISTLRNIYNDSKNSVLINSAYELGLNRQRIERAGIDRGRSDATPALNPFYHIAEIQRSGMCDEIINRLTVNRFSENNDSARNEETKRIYEISRIARIDTLRNAISNFLNQEEIANKEFDNIGERKRAWHGIIEAEITQKVKAQAEMRLRGVMENGVLLEKRYMGSHITRYIHAALNNLKRENNEEEKTREECTGHLFRERWEYDDTRRTSGSEIRASLSRIGRIERRDEIQTHRRATTEISIDRLIDKVEIHHSGTAFNDNVVISEFENAVETALENLISRRLEENVI